MEAHPYVCMVIDRSNGMLNCGNGKKALREFSAFFIIVFCFGILFLWNLLLNFKLEK